MYCLDDALNRVRDVFGLDKKGVANLFVLHFNKDVIIGISI